MAVLVVNTFKELQSQVLNSLKGFPFAGIVALTRVANVAKKNLQARIKSDFDRPTPWVVNSIYTKPASKNELPPFSIVGIKKEAGDALNIHVVGGERDQKNYESALQRGGEGRAALTNNKSKTVMGRAAKRDQYGNLSRTTLSKIVSDVVGATTLGYEAKTKKSKVLYHAGKTKKGQPMIFTAQNNTITPILIGITKATYKKTFPFAEIVDDTYDKDFDKIYSEALEQFMD